MLILFLAWASVAMATEGVKSSDLEAKASLHMVAEYYNSDGYGYGNNGGHEINPGGYGYGNNGGEKFDSNGYGNSGVQKFDFDDFLSKLHGHTSHGHGHYNDKSEHGSKGQKHKEHHDLGSYGSHGSQGKQQKKQSHYHDKGAFKKEKGFGFLKAFAFDKSHGYHDKGGDSGFFHDFWSHHKDHKDYKKGGHDSLGYDHHSKKHHFDGYKHGHRDYSVNQQQQQKKKEDDHLGFGYGLQGHGGGEHVLADHHPQVFGGGNQGYDFQDHQAFHGQLDDDQGYEDSHYAGGANSDPQGYDDFHAVYSDHPGKFSHFAHY